MTPQAQVERRKNPPQMSDEQFRIFIGKRMEEGNKRFDTLDTRLDALTSHVEAMMKALEENTAITRNTAALSEKTAADTAELVAISNFAKSSANVVKFGTRGVSKTARVLIPIVILGAIASAWWHGEPIHLKDILEAVK